MVSLCVASPNKAFDDEMRLLEPAVAKLTAAIQSRVDDENFDVNLTDEALLTLCVQEDTSLFKPFRNYKIKILRKQRDVTVFVCSEDGIWVYFEDFGCSDEVDLKHWMRKDPPLCELKVSSNGCEDSNITNGVSVDAEDGNSSR